MPANTSPIFPLTPRIKSALIGSSALTSRTAITGTTGLTLLTAAGTNGTRIDTIVLKGTGTTIAGQLDLWIYDGTTARLFDSFAVTVVTPSTTVDSFRSRTTYTDLVLASTDSLYISSQVASQLVSVFAQGGDY